MNRKDREDARKLDKVNQRLFRSPFRAIASRNKGHLEFKFYDARGWREVGEQPDWLDVAGVVISGWLRAMLFAKGIRLGYAQRVIIIRKNGEAEE